MLEQLDGETILRQALRRGGDWADICAERKQTTLVQLEAGKIEKISNGVTLGAGVRLVQNFRTAYAYANGLAGDTLLELARTVSQAGLDQGDRPQISIAIQNWQGRVTQTILYVLVIAGEGDLLQTGYESHGGTNGFEIFEARPVEDVAQCAAARAVRMLSARKIKGGPMAGVLHSEAGGTMI